MPFIHKHTSVQVDKLINTTNKNFILIIVKKGGTNYSVERSKIRQKSRGSWQNHAGHSWNEMKKEFRKNHGEK